MLLCFAAPSFAQNVAKIGNAEPTTLAEAIKNASAGQTITLVGDVTENVTISKSLTIDGAGYTYTGTMTGNANLTITIKNLNFNNSLFQKSTKSTNGVYTFEECEFNGAVNGNYPLSFKGAGTINLASCTIKNSSYGLYVSSSASKVNATSVKFENITSYGVYFASGVTSNAFTNVTFKNVGRGGV